MTREEWAKLVLSIKDLYPAEKILNTDHAIQLWYEMLKDLDYKDLAKGLWKYALSNKFPPTISDLRGQAAFIKFGEFNTWEEEWQRACDAVRTFGYYREREALESLPELTRKIVSRLGYRNLCSSENLAVDRANFRDIYNNMVNKQQEKEKLSSPIKQALEASTAKRYKLSDQEAKVIEDKAKEGNNDEPAGLSENVQEGLRKLRGELFGDQ